MHKIPTRLRGTNFCTSSDCFAPSLVRKPSGPKWYETHHNVSLGSNGVDRVRSSRKTPRTFALVRNVWPRVPLGNFTIPNAPKWYETHQNMSLGSNGVDQVRSLQIIPTRLRGTNFCTSLECFAPSFTRQPNGRKCTKTVRNAPKHEFRFQWGGLDAFVAKKILLDFVPRTLALVRPVLP